MYKILEASKVDSFPYSIIKIESVSAAFDTIDHELLLHRLEYHFGISQLALTWIRSYLTGRQQSVSIRNASSETRPLTIGVPQGSVLGPLLFLLYVAPLGHLIDSFEVSRHGYADDTQLYCRLPLNNPNATRSAVDNLNSCIKEVRQWMLLNKLKINDSKTEFLVIGSRSAHKKLKALNLEITVGQETIAPSATAKNLGAIFDRQMTMQNQVADMTKKAYFHLRRIKQIRQYLDRDACAKAVNASVTSRIDYHNALLAGCTDRELQRLQLVQNNAARVLTGTKRREHITPVLRELHWLPIKARIAFKTLIFIHQAVHAENSPSYLSDFLAKYQPPRTLRSSGDNLTLCIPRCNRNAGTKCFKVNGAVQWNVLPLVLRQNPNKFLFKKLLKTHLFTLFY